MSAVRDSLLFRADPDVGFSLPMSAGGTHITSTETVNSGNATQTRNAANVAFGQGSVNPTALHTYYSLLSPVLRVLLQLATSRGPDNEQAVYLIRSFLNEYRPNMVGVFKKLRGVSGKLEGRATEEKLRECVRAYTGLCVFSGWVDSEDEAGLGGGYAEEGVNGNGMDGMNLGRGRLGVPEGPSRGYAFS
jgi:hypothetical protein